MEIIVEGTMPEKDSTDAYAGMCTQEPGDNCWLHLD